MTDNFSYQPDQLVAVVWLTDTAVRVRSGEITWEEAASERWAIEAGKANRVTVLVAVDDTDHVVCAKRVVHVDNHSSVPTGKNRKINRARFTLADDPVLDYLLGPSLWRRRRNPQTTFELRDLPGADGLFSDTRHPTEGAVHLGGYSLVVHKPGEAELKVPAGCSVTIHAAN